MSAACAPLVLGVAFASPSLPQVTVQCRIPRTTNPQVSVLVWAARARGSIRWGALWTIAANCVTHPVSMVPSSVLRRGGDSCTEGTEAASCDTAIFPRRSRRKQRCIITTIGSLPRLCSRGCGHPRRWGIGRRELPPATTCRFQYPLPLHPGLPPHALASRT